MINKGGFIKFLSVIVVMLFASFGSAHAAGCDAVTTAVGNAAGGKVAYVNGKGIPTGEFATYGLTAQDVNTFGISYADKATIVGAARCSSRRSSNTYALVPDRDLGSQTGANCYCGLSTVQDNEKNVRSIVMPWVAYNPQGVKYANAEECLASCVEVCATGFASVEMLEFRNVAFSAIEACELDGGANVLAEKKCTNSGGSWGGTTCKCPSGYTLTDGECVKNTNDPELISQCTSTGGTWNNNACTCPTNAEVQDNKCVCKQGYFVVGGNLGDTGAHCVLSGSDEAACYSSGGTWSNNACVCPTNAEFSGKCICRAGYHWKTQTYGTDGCVADSETGDLERVCIDSGGTWSNNTCTCVAGYHTDSNGRCVADSNSELGRICVASGGTWSNNTCRCQNHAELDNQTGRCVCSTGYYMDGTTCVRGSGTGGSRGGDIKIATTKYNNTQFGEVSDNLDITIDKIKDVVVQALANTTNVASISSTKQTRPDDLHACATGKTCLLVTTPAGVNNWYEIIDCSADNVLSGVNFDGENVSFGPGEPWGWKIASSSGNLMCRSSDGISCPDNTWVTNYDKNSSNVGDEIVFGTMQRVAIAERTRGSIVTLPTSGLQSGDVCVCKATKYKLWDSGTSSYGPDHDINTDKWFVAGIATSDSQCFDKCGDDRINGISKEAYYRDIANTCSADAEEANMCRYHEFFDSVVNHYTANNSGSVRIDGTVWNHCEPGGSLVSTNHCSTDVSNRGTWIVRYYNQSTEIGYVYGMGGYANVPSGTQTGDVVDVTAADVSQYPTGKNASVCVALGYKNPSDASDTNIPVAKAFVAAVEGEGDGGVLTDGCAEYATHALGAYYSALADVCFEY